MADRYVVNQPVVLTCTFTVAGTNTDPSTISLVVTDPAGTATTYTYAGTTITRTAAGIYTKTVTADSVGVWSYVWTGTGTAADVQDGTFTVFDDVPLNYNYCTLDELKTERGTSNTNDDMILQLAIGAASRQIDNHCGQRFWTDTTATAYEFFPESATTVRLTEDLLPGISTLTGLVVKVDIDLDGAFESTLTINTDFQPRPRNALTMYPPHPYTELEIVPVGSQAFFPRAKYGRASVQITAKMGWPTLPDDVKKACLIQAQMLGKSKDVTLGGMALSEGSALFAKAVIHPFAAALLSPYQKPAVG